MFKKKLILLITAAIISACIFSSLTLAKEESYTNIPETVDPNQKYLFYMHGVWIEMKGLNRAHPVHGRYEYNRIVNAVSAKGFVVISEARLKKVQVNQYANKVVHQIRDLLNRGVPPENITVIGHSKGGSMTLIVSSMLKEKKVNFVVMAGCGKKGTEFRRGYEKFLNKHASQLNGRILSIYDTSDRSAGTCREAFKKTSGAETREIVLDTGRGHGIFYSPESIWIDEVVKWTGM